MDVVVTGASGLIGSALIATLNGRGHRAIALVRRPPTGAEEIHWDPIAGAIDAASLEGVDAVIHLAGAGIGDKRWRASYQDLLVSSRTEPTELLASTLASLQRPPRRLVSGSAIGFYGDRGDEVLNEKSAAGVGFLPDLVVRWEGATTAATEAGISTALARTGIVLTEGGGALAKMLPLFKMGVGGRFGSGRQYMSWITLEDEVAALIHLIGSELGGPVNLTAPTPVTNREFTSALGQTLGRPTLLPVPAFAPKLLLGSAMAQALLFDSQRIESSALVADGFTFGSPTIGLGLAAALAPHRSPQ